MSKSRISSPKRKSSSPAPRTTKTAAAQLKPVRFLGLALGGGKANKSCLVVLEYFSSHHKLFLTRILDRFENSLESADSHLHAALMELEASRCLMAVNVALQLPKCLRCELKCPGAEKCAEP